MNLLIWVVSGIAFSLILIALTNYLHEKKFYRKSSKTSAKHPACINAKHTKDTLSPYIIPQAPPTATPKYAVIDLQTTGLSVTEDRIIELSWLILDKDLLLSGKVFIGYKS